MRGVRRESAHMEREWQPHREKCSWMCERQRHEGETGLGSASTSLPGQHTWDPLDVMGTRWNSGDLFSALSSFICLPAKRQRNNNEEKKKPDQCTQFRDEKKEAPRRSGAVEGLGFWHGLHPSLAPRPPYGQKQASQGSRQASSLAKRYTGSFLSIAHFISCPDFPTWQKWGISQQRLRLQFWREAANKRQRSWPHWLVQWNRSERKSRPAITKGANLEDKHCNTSSGSIQVQTEPQRRGTVGGRMEAAKVSMDHDWSKQSNTKLNFINFLCGKLKYILFHI